MRIGDYLSAELDETLQRLDGQVFDLVPPDRQLERFPESNSIAWAVFHSARHAELALRVVGRPLSTEHEVAGLDERAFRGGSGLQEVQQPWFGEPDPAAVRAFASAVFADVRAYLGTIDEAELDRVPDAHAALTEAGVDSDAFGWLHAMWTGRPVAFLARWPLTTHLAHHVGEMITYRNQMGLSPFR